MFGKLIEKIRPSNSTCSYYEEDFYSICGSLGLSGSFSGVASPRVFHRPQDYAGPVVRRSCRRKVGVQRTPRLKYPNLQSSQRRTRAWKKIPRFFGDSGRSHDLKLNQRPFGCNKLDCFRDYAGS